MRRLAHSARVVALLLPLGVLVVIALCWAQGYRAYAVRTGSMTPTYPTGAVVVDAPAEGQVLHQGDVVTFRTSGGLVTHRLSRQVPDGWVTKGDGNRTEDPWVVPPRNVVGRVIAGAPRGGYVLVFLAQPSGVPSMLLLSLSVWCSWVLFFGQPAAGPGGTRRRGGSAARSRPGRPLMTKPAGGRRV